MLYIENSKKKRNAKRDSGGIAIFIRDKYVSSDTLVFQDEDDILWVKLCGQLFNLDDDLYVCLSYVLPDGSSRQSMVETNIFDRLLNSMVYINNIANDNAYLLMYGDFNACIATSPDFVVDDSNRHVDVLPDEYTIDSNVTQRVSQDTVRPDSNGLLLLELCRQTGMRILNGRTGNDANVGKYTRIAPNGSSVIDYMLASQSLFEFIQYFEVHDPNI